MDYGQYFFPYKTRLPAQSKQKIGLCTITLHQPTGKTLERVQVLGVRGAHREISLEQYTIHAIQPYLC